MCYYTSQQHYMWLLIDPMHDSHSDLQDRSVLHSLCIRQRTALYFLHLLPITQPFVRVV